MSTIKRLIPLAQLLFILPAGIFMLALVARTLGPLGAEPAQSAQQIVTWYSQRIWTLWVLLCALPLAVMGIGCALLREWDAASQHRTVDALRPVYPSRVLVKILTLTSAVILVIVGLHVLMN